MRGDTEWPLVSAKAGIQIIIFDWSPLSRGWNYSAASAFAASADASTMRTRSVMMRFNSKSFGV